MRTKQMLHPDSTSGALQPFQREPTPPRGQSRVLLQKKWLNADSSPASKNISVLPSLFAGLPSDWYPNLDALKESCRIASSYNWADVDLSPFQGAAMKDWECSSIALAYPT